MDGKDLSRGIEKIAQSCAYVINTFFYSFRPENWDSGSLNKRTRGCGPFHTPQLPRKTLCQDSGLEAMADS